MAILIPLKKGDKQTNRQNWLLYNSIVQYAEVVNKKERIVEMCFIRVYQK